MAIQQHDMAIPCYRAWKIACEQLTSYVSFPYIQF